MKFRGQSLSLSKEIDEQKYRQKGESFEDKVERIACALADDDLHCEELTGILGDMRFLPAGRVQNAIGSQRITTAYNCFV